MDYKDETIMISKPIIDTQILIADLSKVSKIDNIVTTIDMSNFKAEWINNNKIN